MPPAITGVGGGQTQERFTSVPVLSTRLFFVLVPPSDGRGGASEGLACTLPHKPAAAQAGHRAFLRPFCLEIALLAYLLAKLDSLESSFVGRFAKGHI